MRAQVNTGDSTAEFEQNCKSTLRDLVDGQYNYGTGHKHVTYEVMYSGPATLYMGKRGGYVKSTIHVVRELFFKGNGIYYVPMGRRSTGFVLPQQQEIVSVTMIYAEDDYSAKWAKIAASMRKHNINLSVACAIEAYLRGDTEYIAGCGNYYTKLDKPRCSSFKDVTQGQSIAAMWKRRAPADEFSGEHYSRRVDGVKRDRSVSLYKAENGTYRFSAASEYSGCGNGDYYAMYSPTVAVFLERD